MQNDKGSFDRLVLSAKVFSCVTPVQKKLIVDVLRDNGEFVAVTGYGVNDASAMRSANLPLPLLAVQLLWLNLVTNGIQDVALAFEGGEPGAMKRKPRRTTESIFNKLMIQQTVIYDLTMGLIAFGTWYYLIDVLQMAEEPTRDIILLLVVFMQNVHVFNCRS